MGILGRFSTIINSNINAVLDKLEDPSKMVDQYLIDMTKDLAVVKQETAGVMAEETRCRRLVDDNKNEIEKYVGLAKKALTAGNEEDAKTFLAKKQELESLGAGLSTSYEVAKANAAKMKQLHDKLVKDINDLNARKNMIKSKAAVAKTQEKVNKYTTPGASRGGAAAFDRMEDRVNKQLDKANALSELNTEPIDEAKALEEKYKAGQVSASVDSELEAMKAELGIN